MGLWRPLSSPPGALPWPARYLICAAAVAGTVYFSFSVVPINATTVALALLLIVLIAAARWGLYEAVFTALLGVLCFNFFFLPPVGTFTIADPQNWVALVAFLVTAVIASQLSHRAARRAEEANARRLEMEQLFELSRALLLDETGEADRAAVSRAGAIFGIERITFYDAAAEETYGSAEDGPITRQLLASVARSGEAVASAGFTVVPVQLGSRQIGSLAMLGCELSSGLRESIAGLLAINHERARALRRAAEAEAARRNEEMRSSLLDGLAHDLKTPLTAIRTCVTHLIGSSPRSEAVQAELHSIIDQESRRLEQTITEAIQLARVESSRLTLNRSEAFVSHIFWGALSTLGDDDMSRYQLQAPEDLTVHADADLLRQALKRILENAKKYTSSGSPVVVTASRDQLGVTVSVTDRGPGIEPEELGRIFEKFYRGRRGRGKTEGTGMGLAIARSIVEAHNGSIRAENRPDGGALIAFSIPDASPPPNA